MSGAGRTFVVALARASRKARRYLRDVNRADREDILATAVLWSWEHRATYTPNASLEQWFLGNVRNAYRTHMAAQSVTWEELGDDLGKADDASTYAEAVEVAKKLKSALSPRDRHLVSLLLEGHSTAEIAQEAGLGVSYVKERLQGVQALRGLLPDPRHWERLLRSAPARSSDQATGELAPIDRELQELEFAPPAGKDCPPCWRCKWFEGYLPVRHRRELKSILVEPEVRAAVSSIEARKIEIAEAVRDGSIFQR